MFSFRTSWVSVAGSLAPAEVEVTLTPGLVRETLGQEAPLHLGAALSAGWLAGKWWQLAPTFPFDLSPSQASLSPEQTGGCLGPRVCETLAKAPNQPLGALGPHVGVQ